MEDLQVNKFKKEKTVTHPQHSSLPTPKEAPVTAALNYCISMALMGSESMPP